MTNLIVRADGTTQLDSACILSCEHIEQVNNADDVMFGAAVASCISVEVRGGLSTAVEHGEELTYYRVDDENTQTLIGKFFVDKPTIATKNSYKFEAYDAISLLDKDLSEWLYARNEAVNYFPRTLTQFAQDVASQCNVTLDTTVFPNSGYLVKPFYSDGLTGRDLIGMVAELAGRFVRATSAGHIEFAWYADNESVVIGSKTERRATPRLIEVGDDLTGATLYFDTTVEVSEPFDMRSVVIGSLEGGAFGIPCISQENLPLGSGGEDVPILVANKGFLVYRVLYANAPDWGWVTPSWSVTEVDFPVKYVDKSSPFYRAMRFLPGGVEPGGVDMIGYYMGELSYESFATDVIDRVQIHDVDNDIGVIYPEDADGNTYSISGNILLTGSSAVERLAIAEVLYNELADFSYTPCTVRIPKTELIHAGDRISVTDVNGNTISTVIMSASSTASGLSLSSTGNKSRDTSAAVTQRSFSNVLGKVLTIEQTAEGLKTQNSALDGRVSVLSQTVDEIEAKVGGTVTMYNSETEPVEPSKGDLWHNAATGDWKQYNGSDWETTADRYTEFTEPWSAPGGFEVIEHHEGDKVVYDGRWYTCGKTHLHGNFNPSDEWPTAEAGTQMYNSNSNNAGWFICQGGSVWEWASSQPAPIPGGNTTYWVDSNIFEMGASSQILQLLDKLVLSVSEGENEASLIITATGAEFKAAIVKFAKIVADEISADNIKAGTIHSNSTGGDNNSIKIDGLIDILRGGDKVATLGGTNSGFVSMFQIASASGDLRLYDFNFGDLGLEYTERMGIQAVYSQGGVTKQGGLDVRNNGEAAVTCERLVFEGMPNLVEGTNFVSEMPTAANTPQDGRHGDFYMMVRPGYYDYDGWCPVDVYAYADRLSLGSDTPPTPLVVGYQAIGEAVTLYTGEIDLTSTALFVDCDIPLSMPQEATLLSFGQHIGQETGQGAKVHIRVNLATTQLTVRLVGANGNSTNYTVTFNGGRFKMICHAAVGLWINGQQVLTGEAIAEVVDALQVSSAQIGSETPNGSIALYREISVSHGAMTEVSARSLTTVPHVPVPSWQTWVQSSYRTASAQDLIDNGKQVALVSGSNIKTVNGLSLLGSGDLPVSGLPGHTASDKGKYLGVDESNGNVGWLDLPYTYGTTDLTPGVSPLATGHLHFVIE